MVNLPGDMVCGLCGREVQAHDSWTCPFCESDLRETGIQAQDQLHGGFYRLIQKLRAVGLRGVDTPSCGKCGLGIHPDQGFICPDCGHDLRAVGVISPIKVRWAAWRKARERWKGQDKSRFLRAPYDMDLFILQSLVVLSIITLYSFGKSWLASLGFPMDGFLMQSVYLAGAVGLTVFLIWIVGTYLRRW